MDHLTALLVISFVLGLHLNAGSMAQQLLTLEQPDRGFKNHEIKFIDMEVSKDIDLVAASIELRDNLKRALYEPHDVVIDSISNNSATWHSNSIGRMTSCPEGEIRNLVDTIMWPDGLFRRNFKIALNSTHFVVPRRVEIEYLGNCGYASRKRDQVDGRSLDSLNGFDQVSASPASSVTQTTPVVDMASTTESIPSTTVDSLSTPLLPIEEALSTTVQTPILDQDSNVTATEETANSSADIQVFPETTTKEPTTTSTTEKSALSFSSDSLENLSILGSLASSPNLTLDIGSTEIIPSTPAFTEKAAESTVSPAPSAPDEAPTAATTEATTEATTTTKISTTTLASAEIETTPQTTLQLPSTTTEQMPITGESETQQPPAADSELRISAPNGDSELSVTGAVPSLVSPNFGKAIGLTAAFTIILLYVFFNKKTRGMYELHRNR